jgi:hypothetical protein
VRIDDRFATHPKTIEVWNREPRAIGLYVFALTYSAGHLTDGVVTWEWAGTHIPRSVDRRRAIDALEEAGLWEGVAPNRWAIHDYLDFNKSREQVIAAREADSSRKHNGRRPHQ